GGYGSRHAAGVGVLRRVRLARHTPGKPFRSMSGWLSAFLFTQLVEVPIYTFALRGRPLVAFGASLITHPFVWLMVPRLPPGHYVASVLVAEVFAIVVEAYYLHPLRPQARLRLVVLLERHERRAGDRGAPARRLALVPGGLAAFLPGDFGSRVVLEN